MTACMIVWGDAATWFEAIGVWVTFGFAVFLYWRQGVERRRDQASKIHVLTARNESYTKSAIDAPIIRQGQVKYRVSNTSNTPAYEAVIALLPGDASVNTSPIRSQSFESLLPNEVTPQYEMLSTETVPAWEDRDRAQPRKRAPVSIEFTDDRGRRWKRMPDGKLFLKTDSATWKRQR
ncbi:MAG: hypothetical protein ABL953_12485 [Ilumatobacteraceae bacterium]